MKRIKETYLLFIIVFGLFSLSIYSTYSLFTEEYVVGKLDINTSTYDIKLSDVTEYKRIDTYSNNNKDITLNILNPSDKPIYYGIYTSSLDECINIIHDDNYADVKDIIDSSISKTIKIRIDNSCLYNYSFNLYILTGNSSFNDKDKIDDKYYSIKSNNTNNVEENNNDIKEDVVIEDNLVNRIKSLYDSDNSIEVNVNNDIVNYVDIVGLMKDNYDNIRYYGNNPNNYINLNNELWRIIGLFKNNDNYMVKVIRNDSLDDYKYSDISNNYKISNIMKSINPNFTESNKYWNTLDSDFVSLLSKNNYYLGSVSLDNNSKELYDNERNTDIIWNGYLGLMYPSDYIYSRDLRLCNNISDICDTYLNGNTEYMISSIKDTNNRVLSINNNSVSDISIDNSISIRPVGYLNNNTILKDGNGTIDNPYVIELK